jgi:hypothetical protein
MNELAAISEAYHAAASQQIALCLLGIVFAPSVFGLVISLIVAALAQGEGGKL